MFTILCEVTVLLSSIFLLAHDESVFHPTPPDSPTGRIQLLSSCIQQLQDAMEALEVSGMALEFLPEDTCFFSTCRSGRR